MVVVLHGLVPVTKYAVNDDVEDRRGDDISLGDAVVCWERCSKEAAVQASVSSVVDVECAPNFIFGSLWHRFLGSKVVVVLMSVCVVGWSRVHGGIGGGIGSVGVVGGGGVCQGR